MIPGTKKTKYILLGSAVVALFVIWTFFTLQPTLISHQAKFSIFSRNYQDYGVTANNLLPAYNLNVTDPPSNVYLSKPPLVPLVMYGAAKVFGDKPITYQTVIIIINAAFFVILSLLVGRRFGARTALFVLLIAALSTYAIRYGEQQTFEQLSVIGMFSSIFFYFEWLKSRRSYLFALIVLSYVIGFAADYLAFFSALVICLHWLIFVRNRTWADLGKISLLPIVTIGLVSVMVSLMLASEIPLSQWFGRADSRATGFWSYEYLYAMFKFPLALIGPVPVAAAILYFVLTHWRRINNIGSRMELGLLHCLLWAGLFPILFFPNAYVNHPFWIMFLIPFFAVSGGLAFNSLLKSAIRPQVKSAILLLVVIGFLAVPLRAAALHTDYLFFESGPEGRNERIARLSESIRVHVSPGDELLVLYGEGSGNELSAFYTLWIPTTSARTSTDWERFLVESNYSLVLSVDASASDLVKTLGGGDVLASDGELVFYRMFETSASNP